MGKVFDILRSRWPEVVMIVVLQGGLLVLLGQFSAMVEPTEVGKPWGQISESPGKDMLLGFMTIIFLIVWQMLCLGFLRTACTEGCKSQEPKTLVRIGSHFFWRVFIFEMIFSVVYLTAAFLIFSLFGSYVLGTKSVEDIPVWVEPMSLYVAVIILIKPRILIPALIVAGDWRLGQAFRLQGEYRIRNAGGLIKLFLGCFAAIFSLAYIMKLTIGKGIFHYLAAGVYGIVASGLTLLISLVAIKYVMEKSGREFSEVLEDIEKPGQEARKADEQQEE